MALLAIISALFLSSCSLVSAAKHGTIGYGINMYHPACCTACSDVLGMVFLDCTTFSEAEPDSGMDMKLVKRMDMEMAGETSEACYANNQSYQETLSYCISTHCDAEGVDPTKQNQCFQKKNHAGSSGPNLQQSLPVNAPTMELAKDAEWLNLTMLVNEAYWQSDRGTIAMFETVEKDHVSWSIAIMVIAIGAPLLTATFGFISSRLPFKGMGRGLLQQVQSYIILPALWRRRHSQPLPWKIGYAPSRVMAIWIFLFVFLNTLASATPFRSVQPNTWFTSRFQEIAIYVANRTGVLSFANVALAIFFSCRNNPIMYFSSWDRTMQLTFHRWCARVAVVQAVAHSIIYTADYCLYMGENTFAAQAKLAYFWWGIIATTALGLMVGFAALPLRSYAYEFFLVLHILLAIISLLGSWYHVDIRFSKRWGYEVWLYIAFAFWAYDRLLRVASTLYHSFTKRPTALLEAVPGTNAVMMTVCLQKPFNVGPGQHAYVYFPSAGKIWESHPFTVADWVDCGRALPGKCSPSLESSDIEQSNDKLQTALSVSASSSKSKQHQQQHYIRCLFRAHKGITRKIHQTLAAGSGPSTTIPIAIEGLYGARAPHHFALNQADVVLCIAGGIGITYAAGFARQYAREAALPKTQKEEKVMGRCRKFVLGWSVREGGLMEYVRGSMLPGVGDGALEYRFWVTGEGPAAGQVAGAVSSGQEKSGVAVTSAEDGVDDQVTRGRMDVAVLTGSVMGMNRRVVVMVCGPGSLADDVRVQVTKCSREGYLVDLIEESFAW